MYTAFYGLREKPFALSPDPRYLFLAESHREALAHLLYGIEQGEGFIAITGEVGTGKTTLCRTLLRRLGSGTDVAFIFNPDLSALELLQAINHELGLPTEGRSRLELHDDLNQLLVQRRRDGRRVLLIIDEAQNLDPETLEQVRLLSNLETETSKLIQILLLGQPELDLKLESSSLRQLKQRISIRWRLEPLSASETRAYVRHRLRIAAGAERDLFTETALREIHSASSGIPRLVNVLCDRALLAGYGARSQTIDSRVITEVSREIRGERGDEEPARAGLRALLTPARVAVALGLFAVAALGGALVERAVITGGPEASPPAAAAAPPPVASPPPPAEPPPALAPASPAPTPASGIEAPPSRIEAPPVSSPAPGFAPPAPASPAAESSEAVPSPARGTALALDALLAAWGHPPSGELEIGVEQALGALRQRGLDAQPLPQGDLSLLRRLDYQGLLRVTGDDGAARWVALVALDAYDALVVGWSAAGPRKLRASEIAARWEGEAYLIWSDFEQLPEVLGQGESGDTVVWLQESLTKLGFFVGPASGQYDAATREAVRSFQESRGLEADGSVGPLTKMALYRSLGRYSLPRLVSTGGVG
jgi:general secretion pathway protein A